MGASNRRGGGADRPSQRARASRSRTRRRGEALEAAILKAAWEEFQEVGYMRLTIEGVARRAGTGKAVVYRRWPNRAELFITAARQHMPSPPADLPDTGTLRGDVLALLTPMTQALQVLDAEAIHGLMAEYLGKMIASIPLETRLGAREAGIEKMTTLLERAAKRGEVDLDKVTPRIASLPFDLARNEILLTQAPMSETTIHEIVDDIFLPLVRP